MAIEYIKKGNGKPVAGKTIEALSESDTATMMALTEIYEEMEKSKNELMLALTEVYEANLGGK